MPAIQPARLKQQAAQLAEHFENPPVFVRSLHHMLEFYADRARRPGQAGTPRPLALAYKVHPPVLRQILLELGPLVAKKPLAALALCDALWEQPYLEMREMACMQLGQIPLPSPAPVLERVRAWITTDLEDHLITAVLTHPLIHLRRTNPQAVIALIQDWLDRANPFYQQLGLRALRPMIDDLQFENLPVFFRLIHPLVRVTPSGLRPDLLDVLGALAHRSAPETAYFLRQTLALPDCPDTPWVIRQVLPEFPEETQKSLRNALRG